MNKIGRHFWITPGGGIEGGAETGLAGAVIGRAVWTRSVQILWVKPPFTQRETYFRAPMSRFAPRQIAALLPELSANGAPPTPIDTGV